MTSDEIPRNLQNRLERRERLIDSDQTAKLAAVLVPFFRHAGEYRLLFTLWTSNLPTHKGDVSFPGGRYHKEDVSLLHTALRESEEEVGLKQADVHILGPLDDLRTHASNYVITPYIGMIPYPYDFQPSTWEVAERRMSSNSSNSSSSLAISQPEKFLTQEFLLNNLQQLTSLEINAWSRV